MSLGFYLSPLDRPPKLSSQPTSKIPSQSYTQSMRLYLIPLDGPSKLFPQVTSEPITIVYATLNWELINSSGVRGKI